MNVESGPEPVRPEPKKPDPPKKELKPYKGRPMKVKKEYGIMTKSKLVWDRDSEPENNDKYGYRNHKISTAKMY